LIRAERQFKPHAPRLKGFKIGVREFNGWGKVCHMMDRITVNPEQCGGRPCIRGMRIRVTDVLDLLANRLTPQQVIEELPDLEPEDVQACLRYASRKLNHPVLTPA
jgi:uncharacterized protein (DUF433 family)